MVPNSELSVIFVLVLLLELGHVGENVVTEDSISVLGSLELGLLLLGLTSCLTSLVDNLLNLGSSITRESLGRVRNVDATISSTLEGTEDSGTSGSSMNTNIEVSLERSLFLIFDDEVLSIDGIIRLVHSIESDLFQKSSSDKETGAVGSGVVGKTSSESVVLKLKRIGRAHNDITVHVRVDNLENKLLVSSSNDKSIFLGVILVLSLENESVSSEVISLSLSSTSRLGLNSGVISSVLDDFYETHIVEVGEF